MQFAIVNGVKKRAEKGSVGICSCCKNKVIAKCGDIKIWHFAHENLDDCDKWSEGETRWHIKFKNMFPEGSQEVTMKNHRADIYHNGYVIELQHSPISVFEANEREEFYSGYGKMVWVFDMIEKHISNHIKEVSRKHITHLDVLKIKYPKKILEFLNCRVYLDFGLFMFKCYQINENTIFGYKLNRELFMALVKNGHLQ